jgi:predicted small integral membrane protein
MVPWQSIQGFSGATAVGSLVFVDWVLITDAFADNLFPVINIYSQSPTWAIVTAVPVLSLVYLLGLLCIGAGEALLIILRLVPASCLDDGQVAISEPAGFAVARYQQLRQEGEILAGSALALVLLALGASLHAWRIEGWRRFLLSVAVCATVVAVGSIALAIRRHLSAARLAKAQVREKPASSQ